VVSLEGLGLGGAFGSVLLTHFEFSPEAQSVFVVENGVSVVELHE
jgi:hypothetical protein